jgi:DNA ligase D
MGQGLAEAAFLPSCANVGGGSQWPKRIAMQKLRAYRAKRDFSKTIEPVGGGAGDGANRFVVHKHSATADHYDLRLQVGDVLKSWAIPKGPSLNPADKRLAVETEDHPLEYAEFEGVIPQGEYGGGAMIVWDRGVWAPMDDIEKSLTSGALKFRLSGEKLRGGWMLVRLKPKPGEDKIHWLLFKEKDLAASDTVDILATRPESVKTGRLIEELAGKPKPSRTVLKPAAVSGAARAQMPERIAPQLATRSLDPPSGADWLHEIKFDGYRTMAHISGRAVKLFTRSGLDWTKRYGDLQDALKVLACRAAIIDGEIVVLDDKGISRFAALQDALAKGAGDRLVFYAFDLLYLDGWDLTRVALETRKDLLAQLMAGHVTGRSAIQISDHVKGDGRALYERACEMGLEGIVSKRSSAAYHPGRSLTWTKTKARIVGDFVIAGYTTSAAAGGLAALALGEWMDGELRYCGKVGTGFDAETLAQLLQRLEPLRAGAARLEGSPKDVIAVRPVLSAHIHFANRTAEGALRHAVFKGLREAELRGQGSVGRRRLISDADLASVWVTNPTRRLFGKSGPTKLDIAIYYASVGDFMLPHILGRPVSLVRCPTGKPQDCFFQRHPFVGMPASVATFATTNSDKEKKSYLAVEDARGYLALAQFGVVEFHVWGTLRSRLEKPDRIVFDLDPGEGIHWRELVEAAVHIRGELQALGLIPFVKTSGGKGIHVVVPIAPKLGWKDVHRATGAIAAQIAASAPESFITTMSKLSRKGRIFIDFHRNARGATAAAPYSLRGRINLPASTPLNWSDIESIDSPEDLNYSSVPAFLNRSGDPWAKIEEFSRSLPILSGSVK